MQNCNPTLESDSLTCFVVLEAALNYMIWVCWVIYWPHLVVLAQWILEKHLAILIVNSWKICTLVMTYKPIPVVFRRAPFLLRYFFGCFISCAVCTYSCCISLCLGCSYYCPPRWEQVSSTAPLQRFFKIIIIIIY